MIANGELFLYGDIGASWFSDGIAARDVVDSLRDHGDAKPLTVRLNSQGGDVFEGVAIFNALRRRAGATTVIVDGLAASIASVIAMGGDEVLMSPASMLMIHDPWTMAFGNAAEMRKVADTLDQAKSAIVDAYAVRKVERFAIEAAMSAETWYTADEAVAAGLADSVDGRQPRAQAYIDPGRFRSCPLPPAKSRHVAQANLRRLALVRAGGKVDTPPTRR